MTDQQQRSTRDRVVRITGLGTAPRKPTPPIVRPTGVSIRTFTHREPQPPADQEKS
jgi:hypothetical protein